MARRPMAQNAVMLVLDLVPFAGLAFLWFVGVIRDRIGAAVFGFVVSR